MSRSGSKVVGGRRSSGRIESYLSYVRLLSVLSSGNDSESRLWYLVVGLKVGSFGFGLSGIEYLTEVTRVWFWFVQP